jgi:hypothetical protein
MNKSAFVRSLPMLPASEVVKQAKARGITITAKHVYVIRSLENKRKLRAGIVTMRRKHADKPIVAAAAYAAAIRHGRWGGESCGAAGQA